MMSDVDVVCIGRERIWSKLICLDYHIIKSFLFISDASATLFSAAPEIFKLKFRKYSAALNLLTKS
jgi:hypothetical protein